VQRWDLRAIDAPAGARSPVVLHSDDAVRAVFIVLEPGQSLGEHQVKEHAWVVVVEGVVVISSEAGSEIGGPGTLVLFEPDERHSVHSDEGARILLLLAPWPGDGHFRGDP
jgi:quercetin dioxygenase-like cupin family protein